MSMFEQHAYAILQSTGAMPSLSRERVGFGLQRPGFECRFATSWLCDCGQVTNVLSAE